MICLYPIYLVLQLCLYSPLPTKSLTFKSFLLLLEGQPALKSRLFVYIYYSSLKFRDDLNGNPMDTLWKAVAIRQEGPSNNKRLRIYKCPNKMTERALAPRCTASSKTLVHLQLPAILRKTSIP